MVVNGVYFVLFKYRVNSRIYEYGLKFSIFKGNVEKIRKGSDKIMKKKGGNSLRTHCILRIDLFQQYINLPYPLHKATSKTFRNVSLISDTTKFRCNPQNQNRNRKQYRNRNRNRNFKKDAKDDICNYSPIYLI